MPMKTISQTTANGLPDVGKVMVTAMKRGTVTHTRGNFHFDPNGFGDAQRRPVPEDVALAAEARGLVRIGDASDDDDVIVDRSVHRRAAERESAAFERLDGETGRIGSMLGGSGALGTFAGTHSQDDRLSTANMGQGVQPIDEGSRDDGYEDVDQAADLGDGSGTPSSSRTRRAAAKRQQAKAAAKADAPAPDAPPVD